MIEATEGCRDRGLESTKADQSVQDQRESSGVTGSEVSGRKEESSKSCRAGSWSNDPNRGTATSTSHQSPSTE
ncbi:hypothetical protein IG631_23415 [Alternaria alternata]|nr:hypothetical protein IG631_23415 [Alternaria alternata]